MAGEKLCTNPAVYCIWSIHIAKYVLISDLSLLSKIIFLKFEKKNIIVLKLTIGSNGNISLIKISIWVCCKSYIFVINVMFVNININSIITSTIPLMTNRGFIIMSSKLYFFSFHIWLEIKETGFLFDPLDNAIHY